MTTGWGSRGRLADLDRDGVGEVDRRTPEVQLVGAGLDHPLVLGGIPGGEGPVVEGQLDRGRLARIERDLGEGPQLAHRPDSRAGRRGDVRLHDLGPTASTGVGHRHLHPEHLARGPGERAGSTRGRRSRTTSTTGRGRTGTASARGGCRTSGSRPAGPRRSGPRRPRRGSCRTPACPRCAGGTSSTADHPDRRHRVSTSASAPAISWPPNHVCSTAAGASAHGMVTGDPVLSTTTVRGLASTTRRTSSS